jgi:plasmid stabilization system protein ParE
MAYTYLFDPIAADEYEEAFTWYEKKSFLAADNFIIRVQEAITAICTDPYRYRNSYKNFRELPLKKYPYQVIYYNR